jgi:hypothetical protein
MKKSNGFSPATPLHTRPFCLARVSSKTSLSDAMLQGQIPDPGGLEPDAANGGGVAGDGGAVGAEDAPMLDAGGAKEKDRGVAEGSENAKGRPIRQARSLGKAQSRKFVARHSSLVTPACLYPDSTQ